MELFNEEIGDIPDEEEIGDLPDEEEDPDEEK